MQLPRRTWLVGQSVLVLAAVTGSAMTLNAIESNKERQSQGSDANEKDAAAPCCAVTEDTGYVSDASKTSSSTAQLHELNDIQQLRKVFNAAKGSPRLILLLSPTCPACVLAARLVQEEIMIEYADPNFKVFVVWLKKYEGAARSTWRPELLSDSRVTHFWDETLIASRFFSSHRPGCTEEWDAFFVYGPKASWEDTPAPLIRFARPIYKTFQKLKEALVPLLKESVE